MIIEIFVYICNMYCVVRTVAGEGSGWLEKPSGMEETDEDYRE